MKVKELIEKLKELDQEKEIKTLNSDYDYGNSLNYIEDIKLFDDIGEYEIEDIIRNQKNQCNDVYVII